MPLTTGLVFLAAVGAGAVIFPERIAELWQSRDWLKPSDGWSALLNKPDTGNPARSASAAPAAPPLAAAAPPTVAEPAFRSLPEAVVIKAIDVSPVTTSSIAPAKERAREASPPARTEADAPEAKTIVAAVETAPAPPKIAAEPPPPPLAAAVAPSPEAAAVIKPAVLTAPPADGAPVTRAAPERSPPVSAEVTEALKRARGLVERGDIAGARLLLEHAAAFKDPRAIMALGETYDPAMLARWGARGIRGDAAKARALYEKAAETGSTEARARMLALR